MNSHRNFPMDIKIELGISEALLQAVEFNWNELQLDTPTRDADESSNSSMNSCPMNIGDEKTIPQHTTSINEYLLQAVEYHYNELQLHTPTRESDESNMSSCPMDVGDDVKLFQSSFEVYQRDYIESQSAENFRKFKKNKLEEMYATNSRQRIITNPNMVRMSLDVSDLSNGTKDEEYYEKRRRNNLSSKESRDRKKMREIEKTIQIEYLDKENEELEKELERVKTRILLMQHR